MNWAVFGIAGYVSVALAACVPVLWLAHYLRRPRRWLCHIALIVGVIAFVLAKINSQTHVARIQVDHSEQIAEQEARQQAAREAAEQERAGQVTRIHYAEDAAGEYLDKGGMDDAELKYFKSLDSKTEPAWKQKSGRPEPSTDAGQGTGSKSVEDMLKGDEKGPNFDTPKIDQEEATKPIVMSAADKTLADKLDSANLKSIRILLVVAIIMIIVDYLRRLNNDREAYFPLPIPSRWADGLTPRAVVTRQAAHACRSLHEQLQFITRRGEMFVLMTDDPHFAEKVSGVMYRLPLRRWPLQVHTVTDKPTLDSAFVFETLWYARSSFVVANADRAGRMLARFVELLEERRLTRAHAKQTVHVIWDIDNPIAESVRAKLPRLAKSAGFTLLLTRDAQTQT